MDKKERDRILKKSLNQNPTERAEGLKLLKDSLAGFVEDVLRKDKEEGK